MRTGSDFVHVIADDYGRPLTCGDSKAEAITRAVAQEYLSEEQVREALSHFVYPAVNVAVARPIGRCEEVQENHKGMHAQGYICRCSHGHYWIIEESISPDDVLHKRWCPVCIQLYSLGKSIEQLLILSAELDEHPEGYEGPCNCRNICQKEG